MTRIIATGDYHDTTDEAVEWLQQQGATVEEHNGVAMISLPPGMDMEEGQYSWQYVIGDVDSDHVEIQLNADVNETMLFLQHG